MRGGIALIEERKKLCLCTGINFLAGIIIGTVLFYAHLRSNPQSLATELYYEKSLQIIDVLRVWWLNIMWMLSVFIAHTVLPAASLHIVVGVRGSVSSFSVLYLLESFGIKEAVVSALPQCVSVLPMLMWFSVMCVEKRRLMIKEGKEPFRISRGETVGMFLLSAVAAVAESIVFSFLGYVLL